MAYTDREDLNYLGKLYLIGANRTPFLNMIGGLNTGGMCKSFLFPVAQPWNLAGASQPAISEASSVTGQTAVTYTRGQDYNTVQIFQYTYQVSYAKQSTYGEIAGLSILGDQPVTNELSFQKAAAMLQMALDVEYSFINGTYSAATTATAAATTRGLVSAIDTSEVAAGGAKLSKAMVNQLLRTMAANGAVFQNMVALCGAFQKQMFSDIYGYAPEDRNIGGVNVKQVETDFAMVAPVWCPNMPTSSIYFVDVAFCAPMFLPVNGRIIVDEILAKSGASEKGQLYAQIGLDYGPEEYHGSITGLATS